MVTRACTHQPHWPCGTQKTSGRIRTCFVADAFFTLQMRMLDWQVPLMQTPMCWFFGSCTRGVGAKRDAEQ